MSVPSEKESYYKSEHQNKEELYRNRRIKETMETENSTSSITSKISSGVNAIIDGAKEVKESVQKELTDTPSVRSRTHKANTIPAF